VGLGGGTEEAVGGAVVDCFSGGLHGCEVE
jgi:hypothetical protein